MLAMIQRSSRRFAEVSLRSAMNSHWLRTMDNNSPKQGIYLCPKCLETYRPFAGTSHNKNIGELIKAKQCLVIKVPATHSANAPTVGGQQLASTDTKHTYHCFLMQWPETPRHVRCALCILQRTRCRPFGERPRAGPQDAGEVVVPTIESFCAPLICA